MRFALRSPVPCDGVRINFSTRWNKLRRGCQPTFLPSRNKASLFLDAIKSFAYRPACTIEGTKEWKTMPCTERPPVRSNLLLRLLRRKIERRRILWLFRSRSSTTEDKNFLDNFSSNFISKRVCAVENYRAKIDIDLRG